MGINKYINIETFLIAIQLLLSSIIVFFHASGKQFPASTLLLVNSLVYLFYRKNNLFKNITHISRVFTYLSIAIILSYLNFLEFQNLKGSMFYDSTIIEIFSFSLVWSLNFFVFYNYTRGKIQINVLSIFAVLFFIAAIYSNYRAYSHNRIELGITQQYHYYYFLLTIIPILIIKNSIYLKYLFLSIAFIGVILSLKRMGLVVVAIMLIVNVLLDLKTIKWKSKLLLFLVVAALIGSVFHYSSNYSEEVDRLTQRVDRLQEDNGSGRLENAEQVLLYFKKQPFSNVLIGNGFWSMYIKHGHFVDMEWFAILFYYGIFGLIPYILFHIFMLKRLLQLKKQKHYLFSSFLNCYIIFFTYSFAAELFCYQYLSVPLFIYLGAAEGIIVHDKTKIKHQFYKMYGLTNFNKKGYWSVY